MDLSLTEEQKQIKALARDFCKREVDMKRMRMIEEAVFNAKTCEEVRAVYPRDLLQKLHDVGLAQLAVPMKYGGTAPDDSGNVTRTIVSEELAYFGGPVADLVAAKFVLCAVFATIADSTDEQKQALASQVLENPTMLLGGCVSEPVGGSDPHIPYDEPPGTAYKTFAYKDGNEWVINGDKMFSTGGAAADLLMVSCRTDKNKHVTEALSAFMVPVNTPGLTQVLNRLTALELGGNAQNYFDNVRVPESSLLGQPNKACAQLELGMGYKWSMFVRFLGEMQRIYDDVREYAKQRVQGGKPIIQHSMVAALLGEAAVSIEALRAYIYKTAWESDQWEKCGGPPNRFWGKGCLYLTKKTGIRLCEIIQEIYGGIGKSVDMPLEGFIRRMYGFTCAGMTMGMNALECAKGYDEKYNF